MDGGRLGRSVGASGGDRPLTAAEELLVWSFRRWAIGFRDNSVNQWALVWREFRGAFGAEAAEPALAAFAALFKQLMIHGRRAIHHHQPCCPCLGGDEAWLLDFVAACQQGRGLRAQELAEAIIEADDTGDLLQAGSALAAHLHGRSLTIRHQPADPPERPTIH